MELGRATEDRSQGRNAERRANIEPTTSAQPLNTP